jgi:hypothetical protein
LAIHQSEPGSHPAATGNPLGLIVVGGMKIWVYDFFADPFQTP